MCRYATDCSASGGDEKLAYSGQRPERVKEDYIGCEGTQRIVALEEEAEEEDNF
jgi:hypothetical protein